MRGIMISDVSEYVSIVCKEKAKLNHENYHNETLLFRGQADCDKELVPAIGRPNSKFIDKTILNEERNMIEMARFKLPTVFRNELNPIELLALLQHYGIPTRLLDITENALVALYFACSGTEFEDKDGEVFVFKEDESDVTNYPIVNAIADSFRFTYGCKTSLSDFYKEVILQPYFAEQNHKMGKGRLKSGGKWIKECCNEPIFCYAPSYSLRQRVQRGRYILFPNSIERIDETDYFVDRIDPIKKNHPSISLRIIIPKENKQKILSDLSILGISEGLLYLDDDDRVCREIANHFKNL